MLSRIILGKHSFLLTRVVSATSPCVSTVGRSTREYSSDVSSSKGVRIGCASGFWGDTAVSTPQLVHHGKLDFLVYDYLSEITMSLLSAAKQKNPQLGFTPDFVSTAMAPNLKELKKQGIRVIANAGGVNPQACAKALESVAKKNGVDINIATVTGDDLMDQEMEISEMGVTDMDTGHHFPQSVRSMNAYLGAGSIARALDLGADVVITGRCTDSALVLAPLLHTYKWPLNDYEKLAAGSLAGHLIECGAQATGGIFTDWHHVRDWHNIGFPIVECEDSGKMTMTKPPNTGGLVSFGTVAEQLVYEIGDPKTYILPDVICDFSHVHITQKEEGKQGKEKRNHKDESSRHAVLIDGVHGRAPTDSYKVCATYLDGYRATAVCPIGGPHSADKGRRTASAIIQRCQDIYKQLGMDDFTKTNVEIIGSEKTYGAHFDPDVQSKDAVLWLAVTHSKRDALEIFAREVAPAGTSMAPGLTTIIGGRPKVSPVLKLFSFLYPKDKITIKISMNGEHVENYVPPTPEGAEHSSPISKIEKPKKTGMLEGTHTFRLEELAFTRSGDKGDDANIGVIARNISHVPYLREHLTAEAVEEYFSYLWENRDGPVSDRVKRYSLPGIGGFNFLLKNSLGGGGVASLRHDPQGKALGQLFLDFKIENVPDLLDHDHH